MLGTYTARVSVPLPSARVAPLLDSSPIRDVAPTTRERTLCGWLLLAWLLVRTVAWTALVTRTQPNAPLDLIEWLSWGHEWRAGYHKHPPLPAWIAEASARLTPGSLWGVYLAGYLLSAVCLGAAWRLGREMVSPRRALLAALALDGVIFTTYDAAEFSNNVVLMACWAVLILCLHRALRTGLLRWWAGTGLAAGLALLTKYSIVFLLAPMALFLLLHPEARRAWTTRGPYLAAVVAAVVFAPHALWMVRNHFITIQYALVRSASPPRWTHHLSNPLFFSLSQLARLVPLLFVLAPLASWRLRRVAPQERFDRAFLLALVLGPVLLHLLASCIFGWQLREIWGYPLWTYAGLLLVFCLTTDVSGPLLRRALGRWAGVVVFFVGFTLVKNCALPRLGKPGRIHFPGRQLAEEVRGRWLQRFPRPFPLVVGDCWIAGNIGCYARHRPSVYFPPSLDYLELDPTIVPWTSDADVRRRGGVIVWDAARDGDGLPLLLRQHFPMAQVQPPLVLPPACRGGRRAVRVGLAFVPPSS